MGCSRLREWVGTVTGKGDRWGRDRLGRSEPAFLSASTFALPPLTCTARGRPTLWQLLFLLRGRPTVAVCYEACAGWRVRRLCPPAVALFCGLYACLSLPAMPTALINILPRSFCLPPSIFVCLPPFIPCAPGSSCRFVATVCQGQLFASCKTVPLAAATRACSGGPCAGSI